MSELQHHGDAKAGPAADACPVSPLRHRYDPDWRERIETQSRRGITSGSYEGTMVWPSHRASSDLMDVRDCIPFLTSIGSRYDAQNAAIRLLLPPRTDRVLPRHHAGP